MQQIESAGVFRAGTEVPTYDEHIRTVALSIGTYSIPDGANDPQQPHTEDEVYVVTRGTATLWTSTSVVALSVGDVAFVPAGEEHRFQDATGDFCVLVIFGPAEHTGRSSPQRQ